MPGCTRKCKELTRHGNGIVGWFYKQMPLKSFGVGWTNALGYEGMALASF